MKVLHIASILPAPGFESANRYVLSLIKSSKSIGCSISYIFRPIPFIPIIGLFRKSKWYRYSQLKKQKHYVIEENNVSLYPYISIGSISSLHAIFAKTVILFNKRKIKKEINILKPEIIHAHYLFPDGLLALYIKKQYNIPFILTLQTEQRFLKNRTAAYFASNILKNASHVVCIHPSMEKLILQYVKNLSLIPLGINNCFFNGTIIDSRPKLKIVTVAHLLSIKNYYTSLSIIEKLIKTTDVEYTIIGEGVDYVNIQKRILELKLENNVKILSGIKNEGLPKILAQHNIFLLPSLKETFGIAYIEAMAVGLPIILSKNTGVYQYLSSDLKTLGFEPNDTEGMVEKILELHNNSILYLNISQRCREFSNNFDWGNIAVKYQHIYESI